MSGNGDGEKAKIQATAFPWNDSWGWSVQSDWKNLRRNTVDVIAPAAPFWPLLLFIHTHILTHFLSPGTVTSWGLLRLLVGLELPWAVWEGRWTTQVRGREARRAAEQQARARRRRLKAQGFHFLVPALLWGLGSIQLMVNSCSACSTVILSFHCKDELKEACIQKKDKKN